jgi:hypothetical protein
MPFPRSFCWTRFGTEAGEEIGPILARKERERRDNQGHFFWGIGNPIGPSLRELVRREQAPQVIFSPIRSAPRREDVSPTTVVRWLAGQGLDGQIYRLPPSAIVTSRFDIAARRRIHYALACLSESPLQMEPAGDTLIFECLKNLLTGRQIGASQVTAIVTRSGDTIETPKVHYRAVLRAHLVFPYLITLSDWIPL